MKRLTALLLGLSVGLGFIAAQAAAQETMGPPKVLTAFREFVKPGRGGMVHEKAESAFVQAVARAKSPTHYLAVGSLSGKPRVLFLTGFDSFEAWEKDINSTNDNPTLSAALDRAGFADGDLLSDVDAGAMILREDYSLRDAVDIAHMRYFEISAFHVRQGHDKDWDTLVKMYMTAYDKIPDVHWATYQVVYGQDAGTYIVFNPMKSAAEIDRSFGQNKQFEAAMGEDGMKKLAELSAAAIESSQTNLFAFNPKMSYVSDEWVKADPGFWKPKAAAPAGAKKPAEKPAANQ
jgi:hypothetical protein